MSDYTVTLTVREYNALVARIKELEAALRPAASCQHDLQLPECTIKVTDHGTRATCSECREVWSNI